MLLSQSTFFVSAQPLSCLGFGHEIAALLLLTVSPRVAIKSDEWGMFEPKLMMPGTPTFSRKCCSILSLAFKFQAHKQ